jgi:DNA repair exonuclease SbcCD ATPase subunit
MDAALEGLRDVRRTLAAHEQQIRENREQVSSELSRIREQLTEMDARVNSFVRLLRDDYTDVLAQRLDNMEKYSQDVKLTIEQAKQSEKQELVNQEKKIDMIMNDLALLRDELSALKNKLSEQKDSGITERLARLESVLQERELSTMVDKLKKPEGTAKERLFTPAP